MSVTSFLHLSETGSGAFDIEMFNEALAKKYPGTDTEQSQSKSLAYDITWSRYADGPQFEVRLIEHAARSRWSIFIRRIEFGITQISFYGSGGTFRVTKK